MRVKAEVFWFLSRFVSNDETRPYIHGIRFEPVKDGYRAIATDGHRLTLVDVPRVEMSPDEIVTKPLSIIPTKELLKHCKPNHWDKFLEITEDGRAQVSCQFEVLYISPKNVVANDQEFPTWRQVVPAFEDFEKYQGGIMVNPAYLADFVVTGKDEYIKIRFDSPMSPMTVETEFRGLTVLGVIMPMRFSNNWTDRFPKINLEYWRN